MAWRTVREASVRRSSGRLLGLVWTRGATLVRSTSGLTRFAYGRTDALLEQAVDVAPAGAVISLMRARLGQPSRGTTLAQIECNASGVNDLADKWRGVSIAPRLE
jgi:hypothetical protein